LSHHVHHSLRSTSTASAPITGDNDAAEQKSEGCGLKPFYGYIPIDEIKGTGTKRKVGDKVLIEGTVISAGAVGVAGSVVDIDFGNGRFAMLALNAELAPSVKAVRPWVPEIGSIVTSEIGVLSGSAVRVIGIAGQDAWIEDLVERQHEPLRDSVPVSWLRKRG
jgi:hypothetical protein